MAARQKKKINSKTTFEEKYSRTLTTQGVNKSWNYFLDLIKTDEFQRQIEKFRKELREKNIQNPYDIEQRVIFWLNEYGLDGSAWSESVITYISKNEIVKPEGIDLCKIWDVYELERFFKETSREDIMPGEDPLESFNKRINIFKNFPVVILISPDASLRDIKDFIDKNYALGIKNNQRPFQEKVLISDKKRGVGTSRTKNTKIQERNDFIYKNKHLPRRKIMELLTEKFGGKETIDYGYVGKIISLEEKRRKEV